MAACFQSLKRWLPAAGLVLVVVSSASAQTKMKRGQAIFFSSSDNDEAATNLPSLTARSPDLTGYADAVQAPTLNFNTLPKSAPLPAPSAPVVPPPSDDRTQRLLDDRNNWSLLTPDEILGLNKPEKVPRNTERDAAGRPKRLTAVERFLQREDSRHTAATNGLYNYNQTPHWDFANNQQLQMNPGFQKPDKGEVQYPFNDTPFNDTTTDPSSAGQNTGQGAAVKWPKLFATPAQPARTAAQKADMDEFRKLLRPISPPDTSAKVKPMELGLALPQSPLGIGSKSSGTESPGASSSPLSAGTAKSTGAAPWPTLINQKSPALIPMEPEWKPQLPPWMQPGPQPGVIPQRKF
jgi:hypothetical protein